MLKSSGRRVDLSSPVRRRDAARRLAAARGHPGHHPRRTGASTSASSSSRPTTSTTWSRLGTLTATRGALPRRGGRCRAQHPRRRRHPGRQDDAAELPCGSHPLARAGGHVRGGLRAARSRCATSSRCSAGSPASRAPARSRCAGWSRRRCGCGPRGSSSARCARRRASTCSSRSTAGFPGMCTMHANSAREAVTKMCTLPLLAGENVGSRFVVPTVAASRRPRRARGPRARRRAPGARDRRPSRAGRGRRRRDRRHLRQPRGRARPRRRLPAAPRRVRARRATTWPRSWPEATA